jgi:hypothetical protein
MMTIADSIEPFPDLRAAYEGAMAIAGDLIFLANVMHNTSAVPEPIEGQVIYLARILSSLREKLKTESKPIRDLEAELAGVHEQPIQIGNHVRPSAACLAVDLACTIQNQLRYLLTHDILIRAFLRDEEDSDQHEVNVNDKAFTVAVALAAIPDSYLDGLLVNLDAYWAELSHRIRGFHGFQEHYRGITIPGIVSSLKKILDSSISMEALEAAIKQEFAKTAARRGRTTALQQTNSEKVAQQPDSRRIRLKAYVSKNDSRIELNGKPYPVEQEAAVFVDELIKADGARVSFSELKNKHSLLAGIVITRLFKKIPKEVAKFIEQKGKGTPYRLKVEELQ